MFVSVEKDGGRARCYRYDGQHSAGPRKRQRRVSHQRRQQLPLPRLQEHLVRRRRADTGAGLLQVRVHHSCRGNVKQARVHHSSRSNVKQVRVINSSKGHTPPISLFRTQCIAPPPTPSLHQLPHALPMHLHLLNISEARTTYRARQVFFSLISVHSLIFLHFFYHQWPWTIERYNAR